MGIRVDEAARLPDLTPEMMAELRPKSQDYLRNLNAQLHWIIRDLAQRLWAAETTIGIVPRRPAALALNAGTVLMASGSGDEFEDQPRIPGPKGDTGATGAAGGGSAFTTASAARDGYVQYGAF